MFGITSPLLVFHFQSNPNTFDIDMSGIDEDLESSNSHPGSGDTDELEYEKSNSTGMMANVNGNTNEESARSRSFSWFNRLGWAGSSPNVETSPSPHLTPSNLSLSQRRRSPTQIRAEDRTGSRHESPNKTYAGSPIPQSLDEVSPYRTVSDITHNEASTAGEKDTGPTFSDSGLRIQVPDVTNIESLASGPSLGGGFESAIGAFSSPRPSDISSSSSPSASSSKDDHHPHTPPTYSHPHPDDPVSDETSAPLKEKVRDLEREKADLLAKLTRAERGQRKSESDNKAHREASNRILKSYNIIPVNDAQPTWKVDANGDRSGPLYTDVPNIFREATVDLLIQRAAIRFILGDINTMLDLSAEGLTVAETLRYPPLIARCRFVNAVANFHKSHKDKAFLHEALAGFQHAYGADCYGIDDAYVKQWATACTHMINEDFAAIRAEPLPKRPTGTSKYDNARRLWKFPTTPPPTNRARAFTAADNDAATTGAEDYSESGTLPAFLEKAGVGHCEHCHEHDDGHELMRELRAKPAVVPPVPPQGRAITERSRAGTWNALTRGISEFRAMGVGPRR